MEAEGGRTEGEEGRRAHVPHLMKTNRPFSRFHSICSARLLALSSACCTVHISLCMSFVCCAAFQSFKSKEDHLLLSSPLLARSFFRAC